MARVFVCIAVRGVFHPPRTAVRVQVRHGHGKMRGVMNVSFFSHRHLRGMRWISVSKLVHCDHGKAEQQREYDTQALV